MVIGSKVAHYRIEEKLGEGGMGVVYRATDEKLERPVALKFLPDHLDNDEGQRERFVHEAKTASALNHPHVATVYAIDEHKGKTYLVLEYIDGCTLFDLSAPPEIDDFVRIATEVCKGLQAAHDAGIVHRDIKPENIMLTSDARVKIMDFGVAKLAGRVRLTNPGARVGTLAYTSPEMIQGKETSHLTDLWSLGVTFYELLTGELPFKGGYEAALLYEILNSDAPPPSSIRADVPEHVDTVVRRLLEKDPEKRLASAGEVIELLSQRAVAPAREVKRPESVSVCVLYFENMSPDKDNEYVCAGITEDIITDLSKIRGLNVVSRTDVLPFRNQEVNLRELGESLGVDYVLEGSVRKVGDRLRITAQLTDVSSGYHVWADRFDRLVEDIFEVQNEVASSVADALKISLTESEKESLAEKPTDDFRAYDFYMRARQMLSHRGRSKADVAIEMLHNALSIDEDFVLAYAGLAEVYSSMYTYYDGDAKWLTMIMDVAQKALDRDPGMVEAQFSLGLVQYHNKDFDQAKSTFDEVIARQPYYYEAHRWLGIICDLMGDYEDALKHYEMCAAVKPYSVEPWLYMNMTHRRRGDTKAAMTAAKHFLEVGLRKLEVNPDDVLTLSRFAVIYTFFGQPEKAREALTRILDKETDDGLVLYNCASTFALLNDPTHSLKCLRRALENGFKNTIEWFRSDPDFDALRGRDDFRALVNEFDSPETVS